MSNFYYGPTSKRRLAECHIDIQVVFNRVILYRDCSVLVGHREQEAQQHAFDTGKSTLVWPESKHNKMPSDGVDVAPWFDVAPHIRWNDRDSFYHFGGFVLGVAAELGIRLRWGGDWDGDQDLHDQKLMDLVHFERRTI